MEYMLQMSLRDLYWYVENLRLVYALKCLTLK